MKKLISLLLLFVVFTANAQSQGSPMPYGPRILNTNGVNLDDFVRIPVMYDNGQIVDWIHKDSIGGNVDLSNYYTKPEVDTLYNIQKTLLNGNEAENTSLFFKHTNSVGYFPLAAVTEKVTPGFTKGGQFTIYAEPNGYLNFYTGLQQGGTSDDLSQIMYFGYRAAYGHTLANTTVGKTGTYFGRSAGFTTTGTGNIFIGHEAGYNLTTGTNNTMIGSYRFPANTVLNNNIILADGRNNVSAIGFRVLEDGTTTVPRQTQATFNASTTGKEVVTKEILEDAISNIPTPTVDDYEFGDDKFTYSGSASFLLTNGTICDGDQFYVISVFVNRAPIFEDDEFEITGGSGSNFYLDLSNYEENLETGDIIRIKWVVKNPGVCPN